VKGDERGWRTFAAATMLLFFFGLLIFAALFDTFLSHFIPVFLGLLCIALVGYTIVVSILRTILRARGGGASHSDDTTHSP
jgi:uncharacterized membrane protein YdjX (TVP38/TMEM64 family)